MHDRMIAAHGSSRRAESQAKQIYDILQLTGPKLAYQLDDIVGYGDGSAQSAWQLRSGAWALVGQGQSGFE